MLLGSLAMAMMFHIWRIIAGLISKGPGVVSTAGKSLGGFFTFSGAA